MGEYEERTHTTGPPRAAGDPADALYPQQVAASTRVASWRLTGGGITGSTNDDAIALARAGEPGGLVVLASAQTGGRGRFERGWDSPGGGAYISLLLRPDLTPRSVAALAPAAGLGVFRGLGSLLSGAGCEGAAEAGDVGEAGSPLRLKWPNDVRVRGRKLAGVLVESALVGQRVAWVVVGVGVNVRRVADADAGDRAFLEDLTAAGLDRCTVAAAVLDGLASALATFEAGGFAALAVEYAEASDIVGSEVTLSDRAGLTIAAGTVTGFDDDARLLLETAGVSRSFESGEVTLRTAYT